MRRLLFVLSFLFLAACVTAGFPPRSGCRTVHGACVLFTPDATVLAHDRIKQAFKKAAEHWGTSPDAIRGWTVVIHGYGPVPAFGGLLWGITTPETRRIDVWLERPLCPETVFVHEWGHAASLAAGDTGRPHYPGVPDDPLFDTIDATLYGLPGCD